MMKLELCHADTCLPDYWSGHHLAHIQIPVYPGITLKEMKEQLRSEISQGAVMGSDDLAFLLGSDFVGDREGESIKATKAVYAAINRMKPVNKGQRRFFTDLEPDEEGIDSVYAFFVIVELD